MITAIGRRPVERSTDYETRRPIDVDGGPYGPIIGPRADGSPMLEPVEPVETLAADD